MPSVLIPTASLAVYADYTALKAGVLDWSQRADLAGQVPAFIELAERAMFRSLPLRLTETTQTGTTSGDTIALPVALNAIERVEIESGGVRYTLNYTSPNGIERLTVGSGLPSLYTVEAGALRLIAAPGGEYTYTIYYLETPAFLSDSDPSNAILAAHPDLYLWGALVELARFIMDGEMEQRFLAAYGAVLTSIRAADERRRFPISGGLQIRPRGVR